MNKFIIPFYYTLYSRIKGKSKRIAYIFTFILPVYIYIIGFFGRFTLKEFIGTVIAFIGLMSIYEIGYINNDVITIKKEKNPTLRLTWDEIFYAAKNINKIKFIKYLIGIIAVVVLSYLNFNSLYYVGALILIDFVYIIHNTVRDKKSIVTFFFLSLLRYITVPIIFCNSFGLSLNGDRTVDQLIITFIIIIAIPRTLEKAGEKKYKIKVLEKIKEKTTEFRVVYYLIATIIAVALIGYGYSFLILSLYYLAYRLLILIGFWLKERKKG